MSIRIFTNFLVHGKRTDLLKIGRGPTRGSGPRVNIVLIFSLISKLGAAPDFKNWEDGAAPSSIVLLKSIDILYWD